MQDPTNYLDVFWVALTAGFLAFCVSSWMQREQIQTWVRWREWHRGEILARACKEARKLGRTPYDGP